MAPLKTVKKDGADKRVQAILGQLNAHVLSGPC